MHKTRPILIGAMIALVAPCSLLAGINPATLAVVDTVTLPGPGFAAALSPDGSELYAASIDPSLSIAIVDTATNAVLTTVALPGSGQITSLAVHPDGSRLYAGVSNGSPSRVVVVDLVTLGLTNVAVPGAAPLPTDLAVSNDGSRLYVTDRGSTAGDVHVYDTATLGVVTSLSVVVGSPLVTRIALTPDVTRAYVVSRQTGTVYAISTATNTVVDTIVTSAFSSSVLAYIAITPDGTRGYVTFVCFMCADDRMAVIDVDPASGSYHTEIDVVTTGDPARTLGELTIVPDGSLAFVLAGAFQTLGPDEMVIVDTDPSSPDYHTQVGVVAVAAEPRAVVPQPLPTAVAYVADSLGVSVIGDTTIPVEAELLNHVNPKSKGNLNVAILTTRIADGDTVDFDPFDVDDPVDPSTLRFGPAGASIAHASGHAVDVDEDGDLDMTLHFKTQETGLACGDTEAALTGETADGLEIEAIVAVAVKPCK